MTEFKAHPVGFGSNSEARKRAVPEEDAWIPIFLKWVHDGGELNFQGLPVPKMVEDMLEAYHYYPRHH